MAILPPSYLFLFFILTYPYTLFYIKKGYPMVRAMTLSISGLSPEVRLNIALFLSSCDLSVCVLISREWSATCTPVLDCNSYIFFEICQHSFISVEIQSTAQVKQLLDSVRSIRTWFYSI